MSLYSFARLVLIFGAVCYFVGGDDNAETEQTFADRVSNTFAKASEAVADIPAFCADHKRVCDTGEAVVLETRLILADLAAYAYRKLSVDGEPLRQNAADEPAADSWAVAQNQAGF